MKLKRLIAAMLILSASISAMEKPEPKFIKVFEEGTQNFVWVPSTLLELVLGETFLKMADFKKGAISLPFNKEVLAILEPSLELVAVAKRSQATIEQIKNLYAAMLKDQPFVGVNTIDLQIQALALMDYMQVPGVMQRLWINQIALSSKGAEIDLSNVALSEENKKAIDFGIKYNYAAEDTFAYYYKMNPQNFKPLVVRKNLDKRNDEFHLTFNYENAKVTNSFGLKEAIEYRIKQVLFNIRKDLGLDEIKFTYSLTLICKFTSLEQDSLPFIQYLADINLSDNDLRTLPKNFFKGAINLEKIDLFNNSLSEIPDLSQCPQLKKINFGNNQINTLPGNFLCTHKNIEEISLEENKISSLPSCFLSQVDATKIKNINISNNSLATISRELLERFIGFAQNKAIIDLQDNELSINVLEKVPENLREESDTRGVIFIDEYELEPATKKQKTKDND